MSSTIANVCDITPSTYSHRVDNPRDFNWCPVEDGEPDAFLFIGITSVLSCLFLAIWHRLGSVFVLLAGALAQLVVYQWNLGRVGNAFTLFLGIDPPDMLLYAFLPPLLLDAAIRLDWFSFRKVAHHVISYAFLLVPLTAAVLTPILLFGCNLSDLGWKVRLYTQYNAYILTHL